MQLQQIKKICTNSFEPFCGRISTLR